MRAIRRPLKKIVLTILALFLFPLAVHGALYSVQSRPQSYDRADWSSTGMLPAANAEPEARHQMINDAPSEKNLRRDGEQKRNGALRGQDQRRAEAIGRGHGLALAHDAKQPFAQHGQSAQE